MNDVRHLRPLREVKPEKSLTFALMTVAHHRQDREHRAADEALGDTLWLMHTGRHERLTDREMVSAIRKVVGSGWEPEPRGDAA